MAPSNYAYELLRIGDIDTYISAATGRRESSRTYTYTKLESKEERIKRIAKAKMFASWKLYNERTESIIKPIQICKARHRIPQLIH